MSEIKIYTTRLCGYCHRAKALLQSKDLPYEEVAVDGDRDARIMLHAKTGSRTVPQIWINDHYVGGCMELYALERSGGIDELLKKGR